jgi:hypothetical protein
MEKQSMNKTGGSTFCTEPLTVHKVIWQSHNTAENIPNVHANPTSHAACNPIASPFDGHADSVRKWKRRVREIRAGNNVALARKRKQTEKEVAGLDA